MKFEANIPIYLQVVQKIQEDMISGKILPGQKLPGSRDLAQAYTINPNTAGRVYTELESLGLCFTRRGLGTFATEDPDRIQALREQMASELTDRYVERMRNLGITPEQMTEMIRKKA